jgi:hypothetical protein
VVIFNYKLWEGSTIKKLLNLIILCIVAFGLASCNIEKTEGTERTGKENNKKYADIEQNVKLMEESILKGDYDKAREYYVKIRNSPNINIYPNSEDIELFDYIIRVLSTEKTYDKSFLLSVVPVNYKGKVAKKIREERQKLKELLINDVKQEKFEYVSENYNYSPEYKEEYIIYTYAKAQDKFEKGWNEEANSLIKEIPTDYKGIFHQEIDELRSNIATEQVLIQEEEKNKKIFVPTIGMTKEEVLERLVWGKPDRINTTVTEYGKTEQWVYDSGMYIYFEDGVVTGIQY